MKKELTVQVDAEVLDQAAAHAKARGVSLDELVTRYLAAMASTASQEKPGDELPPITRRLAGSLKGTDAERFTGHPDQEGRVDADLKEEYYRYLEKKHR
ncbi:hypothetical protein CRI93_13905 [Longimonas halophila]|uniref:Antitoxin n=1 Tax=Longimonas halophila TaxID=1469170 RepID=A0A2H3NQ12_9BACT|nr:DUF6364 family protein [Longimonas halophila]PEN05108.1 hypothetical protein CRI93_13905 [Longimonas halophila]